MRRIRTLLSYDGTDYHGWQVQPGLPTIQGALEQVLSGIEGRPVQVAGSGRTDAGVHAIAQVAAFSIENPIPVDNLRRAMNRPLPRDIRVLQAEEAPPDFHPRFQARRKTYEYRIFRGEICSPFERRYVCHHPYPLAIEERVALAPLPGSGFLKHMVRNIVGVLLEAGKGNVNRADFLSRLEPGCQIPPGPTAPAR